MEAAQGAVRGATVAVAALAVGILLLSALQPGAQATRPLMAADGSMLAVPAQPGVTKAVWNGHAILVFATTFDELAGVDAARGLGSATNSIAGPNGLRLFALSAKSTQAGCLVGFNPTLGASRDVADYDRDGVADGRIMDPCHQGQWDAFNKAKPVPGTPAPTRLAALDLALRDGVLVASAFDGPIGVHR